ncbi:MAG TPA: hypothetical protein VF324_09255 [Methanobacterium sp.]
MTKFEELCKIYTKAEKDFSNYRWKCIDFAVAIGDGVADYLECDKEDIQYYLVSNLGQPGGTAPPKETHPRDALFLENDTLWHYGMGINLYLEDIKNPAMSYIFDVALKGEKDSFMVEFPKQQKKFNINPSKPKDLQPMYEFIFDEIKNRFENELEKFLKHQSTKHYPGYI